MYKLKVLNSSVFSFSRFCYFNRNLPRSKFSSKVEKTDVIDDGPIKYSKSPASVHKARTTLSGTNVSRLWYEPYVLITSISVFLIYFAILREENDIDEELNVSLYSRIAGLEEHQLRASLEYNQQHGLDTQDIIKRLKEIEKKKNEVVDS